jgi:hypothetical protein
VFAALKINTISRGCFYLSIDKPCLEGSVCVSIFILGLHFLSIGFYFVLQCKGRNDFLMKMSLIVCVVVQIIMKQTVIAVNVIITVIFPVRLIQIIKHSELMDDGHI